MHKFYPEDLNKEVDLVYFGQNKEVLYTITRELMLKNGLIEHKNPIFILMNNFPYLIYNDSVPEWNMSIRDIRDIIFGCKLSKKDIFTVFRSLNEYRSFIEVKIDRKANEMSYDQFYSSYKDSDTDELLRILSENIYKFLQERKEKFIQISGHIEENILNISKKKEVMEIGSVLKSTIALEILLKADGTRNTTEIAHELNKSVATISTYAGNLKKKGLLRFIDNGKLKRNVKGFKINLEFGV